MRYIFFFYLEKEKYLLMSGMLRIKYTGKCVININKINHKL